MIFVASIKKIYILHKSYIKFNSNSMGSLSIKKSN